jgi:hypothetical protein
LGPLLVLYACIAAFSQCFVPPQRTEDW